MIIKEYEHTLEGEIVSWVVMGQQKGEELKKKVTTVEPVVVPSHSKFLVHYHLLEKMRHLFSKAASLILTAVAEKRPIFIKHHADADGYISGLAIECALMSLDVDSRLVKRMASKAPLYEISDALKDCTSAVGETERFGNSMPLMIVADHGSSAEDLFAYKLLKIHGCKIIVVDHHPIDERVEGLVDCFINSLQFGEESYCAAMLCAELGYFVNQKESVEQFRYYAAVGGISDHIESEALDLYTAGFDFDEMNQTGICIDFLAYYLRAFDAPYLFLDILSLASERRKRLVDLYFGVISEATAAFMGRAKHHTQVKQVNGKEFILLDVEATVISGAYPRMGKAVGILHDSTPEDHVTLGVFDSGIIMRVKGEIFTPIPDVILKLKEKFPLAAINGGGHAKAGSIYFLHKHQSEILKEIMNLM